MKKNPGLAIIIPMYNEEIGAQKCVEQILKTITSINYPIKLIVVNDGSRDKTQDILASLERIHKKKPESSYLQKKSRIWRSTPRRNKSSF